MDDQNIGVETQTQADAAPTADTTVENQAPGTSQVTEQTDSPREDNRDWQGYARKLEAENKSLRELRRERQSQPQTAPYQAEQTAEVGGDEQAIQLLQDIIGKTLDARLSPILQERVWQEFETKPYVKELAPEINQQLEQIEREFPNLPLEKQLELARKNAIADNLDTIRKIERENGRQEGYNSKTLKQTNAGLGESANQARTADTGSADEKLLEWAKSAPTSEYIARKSEIDAARRRQLGL